jgi:hypothetical protein
MSRTPLWAIVTLLVSNLGHAEQTAESLAGLTPMAPGKHRHVRQILAEHPAPTLPGVDLLWHIDRAIGYIPGVVDRRQGGLPFYGNRIHGNPELSHADWDTPHCVGRFIDALMLWEETTGKTFSDEELVQELRKLLHDSLSDQDHQAHFPTGIDPHGDGPGGKVDWHSQREVVQALIGLVKMRDDLESQVLAEKLIENYERYYDAMGPTPPGPTDVVLNGRFIESLIDFHRLTGNPVSLELAQRIAQRFYQDIFNAEGSFPGPTNNQSGIQTIDNLIEFGLYTNQAKYVHRMRKVIDNGLPGYRTTYGLFFADVGPLMEANCSGDMIKAEILLGLNGYPKYLDDAERILRNGLLASQYLDTSIGTPDPAAKDTDTLVYTDANRRAVGGFAFSMPNDFGMVAADMVGGALHGMIDVWRNIVTRHPRGLQVNFLLSKITPQVEIRSHIPVEGRVDLRIPEPQNLFVRIPRYVERQELLLEINGQHAPAEMIGPYLVIPRQDGAARASIRFPQAITIKEETIQGFKEESAKSYRVQWLGDTVWNVTPQGPNPLFFPARLSLYGMKPGANQDR